jgi:hypothetical protein
MMKQKKGERISHFDSVTNFKNNKYLHIVLQRLSERTKSEMWSNNLGAMVTRPSGRWQHVTGVLPEYSEEVHSAGPYR